MLGLDRGAGIDVDRGVTDRLSIRICQPPSHPNVAPEPEPGDGKKPPNPTAEDAAPTVSANRSADGLDTKKASGHQRFKPDWQTEDHRGPVNSGSGRTLVARAVSREGANLILAGREPRV